MVDALMVHGTAAFFAGMVLNGMPCVLPVMPFKIQALLKETAGTTRSRVAAALALTAGSVTFFILLGGCTAVFGLMWGQQFQLPWFRLVLALVLLVAAVATLLGWSWRLPPAAYQVSTGHRLSAFLTGAFAGILSTPCSGPFLGSVLTFAATRSPLESVVIFGAIGAGLAFPYGVLMLWPGLLGRLSFSSRTGTRLRCVLGFGLLAGGLFFLQGFLPEPWPQVAWMALCVGVGIWLVFLFTSGGRRKMRPVWVVAMTILVVTGFRTFSLHGPAGEIPWQAYSDARMAAASGHAVMVEFTADWCINCKALERTTFRDKELLATIQALKIVPLQVDLTHVDDARRELLARFGGYAIPFTVLLDGQGRMVRHFTGMVGAGTLVESLHAIGG